MIKAKYTATAWYGSKKIKGYGDTQERADIDVIERLVRAAKKEAQKREDMAFEHRHFHAANIVDHSEQLATAI